MKQLGVTVSTLNLVCLLMVCLLILSMSCDSPHRKTTIVYQLNIAHDDSVGHAIVSALDAEFKRSSQYEWQPGSDNKIYLRLGVSTSRESSGSSMVSVVLAGVNDRGEPLILTQYARLVPEDGSREAASFVIEDLDRAIWESRPKE